MDTSEKQLRDILGIYHDSFEEQLLKAGNTLSLQIVAKFTEQTAMYRGGFHKFTVTGPDNVAHGLHLDTSTSELPDICNKIIPYFHINRGGARESFHILVSIPLPASTLSFQLNCDHLEAKPIILEICRYIGYIPLDFTVKLDITRETKASHRHRFASDERASSVYRYGGQSQPASVEEFFKKMCDPTYITQPNWRGKIKYNFIGLIKQKIARKTKTEAAFLIEYLYGKKFSKGLKSEDFWAKFGNLNYSDFGIKDAQVMRQIFQVLDANYYNRMMTMNQDLNKILPPKTDLKRWQKIIDPVIVNVELNKTTN